MKTIIKSIVTIALVLSIALIAGYARADITLEKPEQTSAPAVKVKVDGITISDEECKAAVRWYDAAGNPVKAQIVAFKDDELKMILAAKVKSTDVDASAVKPLKRAVQAAVKQALALKGSDAE